MVETDTFLTTRYVMVDDLCKTFLPPESHPGPQAALSRSEIVTLALCGQWQGLGSERGCYRYAHRHLRAAFRTLPSREQFNRHVRQQHAALVACFLHLVQVLAAQRCPYEALDSSGIPTRDAKRRGGGLVARLSRYWLEQPAGLVCRRPSAPGGQPLGDDHRLRLGSCKHQRSTPRRDILCPASSSPPGPGERGRSGLRTIRRRQRVRGASQSADLVEGLWRSGHLPAQAQ
jgi:hypothetical protein